MNLLTALLVLLLLLSFPILLATWLHYYRKIIAAGVEYPGPNPHSLTVVLKPKDRVTIETEGKVTVIVEGLNAWLVARRNGGPPRRVYKIALFSDVKYLEMTNPSTVFAVTVRVLCERECQTFNSRDKELERT
ncbi:MAG: hypothetical protein L7H12_06600 [Sulfolobales archaeon]|nr:hypothetical protein [Sulfolobales archaeon]MCG2908583.1 hypothetical protein [Sulfolobales archaeon]MCQ4448626.1 hypothetical protein [Sulfolobales archaeon]MCQ4449391.1 hypothetical protein [Sulfolobales archaeon]